MPISLDASAMRIQKLFALGIPGVRFENIGRLGEKFRRDPKALGMGIFVFTTHGDVKVRFEDLERIAPQLLPFNSTVTASDTPAYTEAGTCIGLVEQARPNWFGYPKIDESRLIEGFSFAEGAVPFLQSTAGIKDRLRPTPAKRSAAHRDLGGIGQKHSILTFNGILEVVMVQSSQLEKMGISRNNLEGTQKTKQPPHPSQTEFLGGPVRRAYGGNDWDSSPADDWLTGLIGRDTGALANLVRLLKEAGFKVDFLRNEDRTSINSYLGPAMSDNGAGWFIWRDSIGQETHYHQESLYRPGGHGPDAGCLILKGSYMSRFPRFHDFHRGYWTSHLESSGREEAKSKTKRVSA